MDCGVALGQHRAIRQEVSDRIFAPIQSLENEGILYVFQRVKKASQSLPPAGGKGILILDLQYKCNK